MDKYVVQYLQLQKDKNLQNPINTIKTEDLIMTRQEFDNKVVSQEDFKKLVRVCETFDPFTHYIDDYTQMKQAEASNEESNSIFATIIGKYSEGLATRVPDKLTNLGRKTAEALKTWLKDNGLEVEEEPEEPKPSKRVWTAEEIKTLVQTNDKVLYGALKNLYNCQTSDEQSWGETTHANGVGFNAFDAEFLTSVAQFLIRNGFLTDKQKVLTRKKLVKYNAQLTRLANA